MRKLVLALALALLPNIDGGAAGSVAADSPSGAAIVQTALQYVGYAYTTVGNSPSTGFSCIGFVSYVYGVNGIPVPDDLWDAMAYAPAVGFNDLLPGDVLFFQNTVWAGLSHTAIYLGGGRFVHAEWYNRGVVISSFTNDPVDGDYWINHYLGANRPWGGGAGASTGAASPSASATGAGAPQLEDGPRVRVQVAGLNVRVRPSLRAPIRQLAVAGTTLVVLKQYQSWDWVQLSDGSYGWVAGAAIGVKDAALTGNGLPSQSFVLTSATVDGLRVHLRPNGGAPVVASTSQSQKLLLLQRWHGWVRILLPDGTRGWVDSAFVKAASGQPAQAQAQQTYPLTDDALAASHLADHVSRPVRRSTHPAHRARHSGSSTLTAGVRVRSRPGLRAPTLRLAAAGTPVHVLGSWRKWVYVRFPSGRVGWVYRAYVRL